MTEFKHREYAKSHQISFWNKNTAATREIASSARIEVGSWHYEFEYPKDKADLEKICIMLDAAFAIGRGDKQEEILRVLGVK